VSEWGKHRGGKTIVDTPGDPFRKNTSTKTPIQVDKSEIRISKRNSNVSMQQAADMEKQKLQDAPWATPSEKILAELGVNPENGLRSDEVKKRRKRYGPNRLREAKKKSVWLILANQFKSLIILLLAGASLLSFAFSQWMEGLAIACVILINAGIGFFTELKAVRSMEALQKMGSITAKVRRDGEVREIDAVDIVPGDILTLEGGDLVAADARVILASKLQADESTLTGESLPVSKRTGPVEKDAPLADRRGMLFKGTAITRGSGEAAVVAIGMDTELGHISALIEEAEEEVTPLEKRLDQLGHKLIWLTLGIAVVIAVAGILAGREMLLMIETAIALAVAAIPEGLPIVATVALARGMWVMAHRNALINRLSAVETLGATNVIFTDKTGTLTENRMTAVRIALDSEQVEISEGYFKVEGNIVDALQHRALRELLEVGALCNNASLGQGKSVGDPMEVALLEAAEKAEIRRPDLVKARKEIREEAFDSEVKMMATFHEEDGRYYIAVKGAPEPVIGACSHYLTGKGEEKLEDEVRERWLEKGNGMAAEGLRILAMARKTVEDEGSEPYKDLTFIGIVGMLDPPRKDVKRAIDKSREAGIRVVMVTGDQALTALKIGLAAGLITSEDVKVVEGKELTASQDLSQEDRRRLIRVPIFARVSPRQKLDLIALHQANGQVVGMTGDGVNDAPALKKADIGIAMGRRGTQVAREAADMVLKDDAFSSIVAAIEQGRIIFNNIRKFVFYLLSCNLSEIMAVALASMANAPLPILPLQILFLNLVTDVFPALALGLGKADPAVMKKPPRDPQTPILTRSHWVEIGVHGLIITLAVLGSLALGLTQLGMEEEKAVTVSFLTLAFAQLWHVFNMRERGSDFLHNDVTRNPYVWGALAFCTVLILAAVYIPGLSLVLRLVDPGAWGWVVVTGMSLTPLAFGQIIGFGLGPGVRTGRTENA
jgi:Ca2+-transporting ATPase